MNFYRFINSKDVRKHLENIGYEFNALEAAWLVYQCNTAMLAEKHAAWQDIIDTMPDSEINSIHLPHNSLHKFLKQYMEIENRSIKHFFESQDNAFYQFSWSYISDAYKPYYKTVDDCFAAAATFADENDLVSPEEELFAYINMVKLYDGDVYEHINFTPDHQIISIFPFSLSDEENLIYFLVFKGMNFVFPTPFKKGDILFAAAHGYCPNHNLMVFEKMDIEENGVHCAYGYVMDSGYIKQDGFDCLNLEYYKSERFEDEYRTLDYLRKYLLGELGITALMNKYHQILCEKEVQNIAMHRAMWDDGEIEEKWKQNWFLEEIRR